MKKGIVLALFALVASMSYGQIVGGNIKAGYGVYAGGKDDGCRGKSFQVGAALEYALDTKFFIESSLNCSYTSKLEIRGVKTGSEIKNGGNLVRISLPLMLGLRYDFDGDSNLVFRVGPYLSYGIAGKTKDGVASTEILKEATGQLWAFNRFTAGLCASVGFEFKKYFVEAGFRTGKPSFYESKKDKETSVSVSIGRNFNF